MKISQSNKSGLKSGDVLPIYSDYKIAITQKKIEFYAKLIELDVETEPKTFILRS